MTLQVNKQASIDWDENWLDNYENYLVEGYDFRDTDRNGYIIQLPHFNEVPKGIIDYYTNEIDGYGTTDTSTVWGGANDSLRLELMDKTRTEYKLHRDKKKSPILQHNKHAGKYVVFGINRKGNYIQIGSPSNDLTVLDGRLDKNKLDNDKVYMDIEGNGVLVEFKNQDAYDEYVKTEGIKVNKKLYGGYWDTYDSYYKDGVFNSNKFDEKMIKIGGWFDKYIQSTHPSLGELSQGIEAPDVQDNKIALYTEHTVIEMLEDPESLDELINHTFGVVGNTNPYKDGYPNVQHHPAKIKVLETVITELRKHNKHNNPNVQTHIDVAERYIKEFKKPTNVKISQKNADIKKEYEDQNIVQKVGAFLVKDLIPTILTLEYAGTDRKARNRVYSGIEEAIKIMTENKKGHRKAYDVNGRNANKVRQAIDVNQDWLKAIITNPYAFEEGYGHIAFRDLVMYPLFKDLLAEYRMETGNQSIRPQGFMTWLYQHPEPKYSESKDNDFYSYYEILKTGHNQNKDQIFNEQFNNIMGVDVQKLGQYNTIKVSYDSYEKYNRTRIQPNGIRKYNGRDLQKQMLHDDPALFIAYLQASKQNRGESSMTNQTQYPRMFNSYQEQEAIRLLTDAFGYFDSSGEPYDWLNMSPSEYPTRDDLLDEWVDPVFFNNPNRF